MTKTAIGFFLDYSQAPTNPASYAASVGVTMALFIGAVVAGFWRADMKNRLLLFAFVACTICAHAETLIPSQLDPALAATRESAFAPWLSPADSTAQWKRLASKNVPIYHEHKEGPFIRDIYIPNPGTSYWVLSGMTEKELFQTNRQKLKIDDTLVSAYAYEYDGGKKYWALWAPGDKAHLITDKMKALGIGQARIEFSLMDELKMWVESLRGFSGIMTIASLAMNIVLLAAVVFLGFRLNRRRSSASAVS